MLNKDYLCFLFNLSSVPDILCISPYFLFGVLFFIFKVAPQCVVVLAFPLFETGPKKLKEQCLGLSPVLVSF